jgi:hypothetical protein
MTETGSPPISRPRVTVLGVQPGDPPFRVVQIGGETAGIAYSLFDVLGIAHRNGLEHIDLDDPASVRWVGGDKFSWAPRSGPL